MNEEETNRKEVPVYRNTGSYAREHGELELYRASNNANSACKQVIENSISKAFDGCYLAKDCELEAIETFGMERVCYVLALTLQSKEYDGRFSRENKEWARKFPIAEEVKESNFYNRVNTHPAVLDGFVTRIRRMQEKKEEA